MWAHSDRMSPSPSCGAHCLVCLSFNTPCEVAVRQSKPADRPGNEQSRALSHSSITASTQPCLLSIPIAVEEAVRIITGGAPELAVEGNGPVESSAVLTKAVKRPNEDSDEDEEKGAVVPPVHDIYRARQQKRIR